MASGTRAKAGSSSRTAIRSKRSARAGSLTKKNYALPPATLKCIDNIRQGTDCSTDTEVIKRAVALYDEVVRRGGLCLLEEADGTRYKYRP